ncbi:hypothetical protein KP509_21G056600 [Ceratopteris richardii]|uniref:Uncharacterized protein n=1 Tax=Ceratopteris richardii TaxID=49495 RepID=A0A8T2SD49_CERRI|nr:hypothetical protein KP509_21G056600 [Ceratopteris richardii]
MAPPWFNGRVTLFLAFVIVMVGTVATAQGPSPPPEAGNSGANMTPIAYLATAIVSLFVGVILN